MIEERQVKEFDTSLYDMYTIRDAAEVYAIQLTENVQAALRIDDVEKAEIGHHKTYKKSGVVNEYAEIKYYIKNKGVARPGDWLVWNENYLSIMGNGTFTEKYKPKCADIEKKSVPL